MAAKQQTKDQTLFVGITHPLAVRREILNDIKELLHALKSYHEYMQVREQKQSLMEVLQSRMQDIEQSYHNLTSLLPLEALPKEHHAPTQKTHPPKITPKHHSELDALEEELRKVEEAIKKFS